MQTGGRFAAPLFATALADKETDTHGVSRSFEWDADKARTIERKHEVFFDEAATAFGDPLSVTIPDCVAHVVRLPAAR